MFYGVLFYNLFNISSIFIRDRFWFLNFISNFSYFRFPCCFSCFMCYFLEAVSRASSPVLVAVFNSFYPYLPVKFLGDDKIHTFDIFSWLYRITCHFYLLTSNVKLTLPSISNGILISKFMIIS